MRLLDANSKRNDSLLIVGVLQFTAARPLVMIDVDRLFTYTVVRFTEYFRCVLTQVAHEPLVCSRRGSLCTPASGGYLGPLRQSTSDGSRLIALSIVNV